MPDDRVVSVEGIKSLALVVPYLLVAHNHYAGARGWRLAGVVLVAAIEPANQRNLIRGLIQPVQIARTYEYLWMYAVGGQDIQVRGEEVHRRKTMGIKREVKAVQVALALGPGGQLSDARYGWQKQRGEDCDDDNHDQQFDQRKRDRSDMASYISQESGLPRAADPRADPRIVQTISTIRVLSIQKRKKRDEG